MMKTAVLVLASTFAGPASLFTPALAQQQGGGGGEEQQHPYMTLVENISNLHSTLGSALTAAGDDADARRASVSRIVTAAERSFTQAVQIEDGIPHAYALMARLYGDLRSFDKAGDKWDEALQRVDASNEEDKSLVAIFESERRRSRFGKLVQEMNRWDMALSEWSAESLDAGMNLRRGKKDVNFASAMGVATRQLGVYRHHPQVLHDLATFAVLCLEGPELLYNGTIATDEERLESAREASRTFAKAQDEGFEAWAFHKEVSGKAIMGSSRGGGGSGDEPICDSEKFGLVSGAKNWAAAAAGLAPGADNDDDDSEKEEEEEGGGTWRTVTLRDVFLSGPDAVPSGANVSDCRLYVPHEYVNIVKNVPSRSLWEAKAQNEDGSVPPAGEEPTLYDPFDMTNFGGNPSTADGLADAGTPPTYEKAVLLTGYASDNFYHFLTDVLPSMLALREEIDALISAEPPDSSYPDDRPRRRATAAVVLPSPKDAPFVDDWIRLLLPDLLDPTVVPKKGGPVDVLRYRRGVMSLRPRIRAKKLIVNAWDNTPSLGSDSAEEGAEEGKPTHCLTPPGLLQMLREEAWEAAGVSDSAPAPERNVVVYCSRANAAKRRLKDEAVLVDALRSAVEEEGAELVVYDASPPLSSGGSDDDEGEDKEEDREPPLPPADVVRLFQSASAVIGVHGAALSNVAFCREGTALIELGYRHVPQAGHYRHLAGAMGLIYNDGGGEDDGFFLEPDEMSLGAPWVSLPEGGVQEVIEATRAALAREGGGGKGKRAWAEL